MSQWNQVQQLEPCFLEQIDQIYDDIFPMEIRHLLAQWIESQDWESAYSNESTAAMLLHNLFIKLDEHLERVSQEKNLLLIHNLKKVRKILQAKYQSNPLHIALVISNCLREERRVLASASMPVQGPLEKSLQNYLGSERQRKTELKGSEIKNSTQLTEQDVKYLEDLQEEFDFRFKTICNIEQNDKNSPVMKQEMLMLQEMLNTIDYKRKEVLSKMGQIVREVDALVNNVLIEELLDWKRRQQIACIGGPLHSGLDQLQNCFTLLAESLFQIRRQLEKLNELLTKLTYEGDPIPLQIPHLSERINALLSSLFHSSFIVERQPSMPTHPQRPLVLKTMIQFTVKLRLLIKLPELNYQIKVKATIDKNASTVSNRRFVLCGTHIKAMNMDESANGNLSVEFRHLQPKEMKASGANKGNEIPQVVTEELHSITFETQICLYGLTIDLETSCLPVVMISNVSQLPNAWASVIWYNLSTSELQNLAFFNNPIPVTLSQLLEVLSWQFSSYVGRGLNSDQLGMLAEKLTGQQITSGDYQLSWSKFCKEHLPGKSFTFWAWLEAILDLIKKHILPLWIDGCIMGFVNKEKEQALLKDKKPGTFLLRFSESNLGGITFTWASQSENGEVKLHSVEPYNKGRLTALPFADILRDYKVISTDNIPENPLQYLYPNIPKDKAFGKHYSSQPNEVSRPTEGGTKGYVPSVFIPVSKIFNFLVGNPRRLTMEKMISKRFNPQYMLSRRMGMSLPDLHDIKPSNSPMRNLSLRSENVTQAKRSISKHTSTFKIPEIHFPLLGQSVQSYYVDFGNHLSRAINILSPENSALLARYFYLRGLVNLMQRKFLNALLDFQNLYKTDIQIFPTDLVRKMIESLPPLDRSQADQKPELKRLISHLLDKQREVTKTDDHVKKFELPKTHMQVNDFVKRIQESGIVKDTDTIHRLFDALTVGQQKQIDPDTFKDFYTYWKETEAEAQDVNLPPRVIEHLDKNECVYKLSSSVKTNKGVGKIALTPKRLFLLTEGACPGFQDIATFRDIEEVRNTTVTFLLLKIPTLKIRVKYKKDVFEANLKSECDLWHLMVKEMCAGKKMADDHKDPQYLQQALTNVLLMDAVVGSLQSSKIIYAASKLSYFDRMKNEVPMMVPKTTSETLKHKINPSAGETFPQAVEVLLYTPGQLEPTEKHGDAHPKLWCALNGGKVVVFDASTWSLQHSFKVGNSKLKCMIMAEQSQVWIGSADSIIYLINTHSMSCNKQLNDHRREIVDIVVDSRESLPSEVYSCSVDGTVIAWNISSLKVNRRFQLPLEMVTSIQFYKNRLWCCIQDYIVVVSTNGLVRQKVKLENMPSESLIPLLCFQLFPERNEVWASWAGSCELLIWSMEDFSTPLQKMSLQDCSEITCMIKVKNQMWVGGRGLSQGKVKGKVYVLDTERKLVEKELVGHTDVVKSLCSAEDRYVLSGGGKEEGKIAIWKVEESLGFQFV